jgi:putative PEP-CTERM system histidine kinase
MLIGSVGYGLAAAAFGVLALLMLTSWRGRLQGGLLVTAAGLTALWAAAAALHPTTPLHWQLVTALEVARNTAWLVFLARLSPAGQGLDGRRPQLLSLAPAAFVLVYGLATLFTARGPDSFAMLLQVLILTGLVTAISGLVLLEQAYRALRAAPRRQVLPLIVALGGILAYDLFMYSHGLLFRALHQELWAARGYANLLAIPFLLLAARRNPAWSVDVFISRHVAFYTTSLMGIGAYLLVMAVAGYGLRIAGGEWGFVLQVVFFFGALVVLAWMLFSPAARAALRVFLAKHFYSNKYDYREEWLKLTRRLAEGAGANPVEPLPIRGINALAELVGADGAILWSTTTTTNTTNSTPTSTPTSITYQRSALAGNVADPAALPQELAPTDPIVEFLAARRWTINLAQARHNPESHPGLGLPEWSDRLGHDALIVPLLNQDRLWGFATLLNPTRVGRLSYEDIDLLRVAGMQVAAVLAQAEADRLLTESRQFEAFNRFAAFIMHDLKNIIAQQSLVVRNATKYRDDPAFIDDALDTVANSVERMQRLLEQLKRGEGQAQVERVDVSRLIAESVRKRTERDPAPTAELPDSRLRLRVDRERLAAVLGHLLANAQDATPAEGAVRIETALEADGGLVIAVVDTGCGMEEEFIRERLFKPFDSTKGTKGMGIGAYQARQFVQALGGDVRIASAPGEGTRFELCFPAAVVEQEGAAASTLSSNTPTKEASHGA